MRIEYETHVEDVSKELAEKMYFECQNFYKPKLEKFSAAYYMYNLNNVNDFIDDMFLKLEEIQNLMTEHQYNEAIPKIAYFNAAALELNLISEEESK